MSELIVIVAAARTAMGSFQGDFSSLAAHDLGGAAIAAAVQRSGVAPEQVDEVLMEHDAVAQAVTFAMPHDKLGEEVAAAVVLREGASAGERELQDFANQRLAAFKVPKRIVILEEIPKGATGKLQRIGLAQKLGLA